MSDQLWRLRLFPVKTGVFSLGVKWTVHKVGHSPPCSTTVNKGSYTSSPYICLHAIQGDNIIAVIIPITTNSEANKYFMEPIQSKYSNSHTAYFTAVTSKRQLRHPEYKKLNSLPILAACYTTFWILGS